MRHRWRILPGYGKVHRRENGRVVTYVAGDELLGTEEEVRGFRDKLERLDPPPDEGRSGPWKVPRLFDGGTVVVLGGGPGLAEVGPDLWRGRYGAVGTNVAFRYQPELSFFQDGSFWSQRKDEVVATYRGTIVSTAPQVKNEPRVRYLPRMRDRKPVVSDDPAYLPKTVNSGQAAMNLAYLAGAGRIVLLGFDGRANGNWYDGNPRPADAKTYENRFVPYVVATIRELRARGVDVVNATPGSVIDEPVTPEEALC